MTTNTSGSASDNSPDTASQPGPDGCSIAATLAVVGDRWSVLVLRDVFRGVHRFSELQESLGIAKNLLSARLTRLVDAGVLCKVPYQERPIRFEYRLTDMGRDLSPSLMALMGWGDRWFSDGRPPTVLVHDQCGTPLEQRVECPVCETDILPRHIRSRPGPGRSDQNNLSVPNLSTSNPSTSNLSTSNPSTSNPSETTNVE